jgi:hypothetical protein
VCASDNFVHQQAAYTLTPDIRGNSDGGNIQSFAPGYTKCETQGPVFVA